MALAEAFKGTTTLQKLDLCNNNIGVQGATALAEALNTPTLLQLRTPSTSTTTAHD